MSKAGSGKMKSRRLGRPIKGPGEIHTRERIFRSAVDLFARQGYDSTSIRQIAGELNISEAAVYRHYHSKEEILDSIFSYADKMIFSPLPIVKGRGSADSDSIFRGLLSPLPKAVSDPYIIKITRIMYLEMLRNPKFREYYQREYIDKANDYMENFFNNAVQAGALKPCNTRALSYVFNAFRTQWAFQTFIIDYENPPDLQRVSKNLEDLIAFFEEHRIPKGSNG